MAADVLPISGEASQYTDFGSSASATGGKIGSQLINNTSGGGIGIVKLLAIAGVCVVLFRMWRR